MISSQLISFNSYIPDQGSQYLLAEQSSVTKSSATIYTEVQIKFIKTKKGSQEYLHLHVRTCMKEK